MRAVALVLACVLTRACGGSAPVSSVSNAGPGGEPGQTVDLEPQAARAGPEYVGTGETWDGVFTLGDTTVTMTVEGVFARVRASGIADGGTYLVTADGKLVLYVERIGDALLTTARPEVYRRDSLVAVPQ